MAHANIYQVSLFPIADTDHIDEETILGTNDWFIGDIAEYIADTNRDFALQSLQQFAKGFSILKNEYGEYILVSSKEAYFRPLWEYFCKKMHSTISLEEYMSYRGDDDKAGNWIYAEGEMMPFPEFIRDCLVGEPYYLGGAVDFKS